MVWAEGKSAWRRIPWLVLALLLWVPAAMHRSLWSDEFHALHHALRPSPGALLASVREDNHPPLSFLLEHLSVQAFGTSELALRLPSILSGLLAFAVFLRLASRLAPRARTASASLFLASSYCLISFTEARMYGLMLLAGLGILDAIGRILDAEERGGKPGTGGARRVAWLALWGAIGLYSHYYFLHVLLVVGVALALLGWRGQVSRRVFGRLALGGLGAVLLWLPWGWYGFRVQLTHDLPPGGLAAGPAALLEALPHLFFLNTRLGGEAANWVARSGSLLVLVGLVLGLLRVRPRAPGGTWRVLVAALAFGLPVWSWAAAHVFARSTLGWRYLAGAAPAAMLLVLLGYRSDAGGAVLVRARSAGFVVLILAMGAIAAVNARHPGRENYRGAVRRILAEARPGDALLVKPPWDPDPIPTETPWHFYRERVPRPPGAVEPVVLGFDQLTEALRHPRVWFWRRDPYQDWVPRTLRRDFRTERVWKEGADLQLFLYSEPGTVR